MPPRFVITKDELRKIWRRVNRVWRLRRSKQIESIPVPFISGSIPIDGNKITIFNRGQEVYELMMELFSHAKQEILIDSFIFASDELGQKFQDVLIKKAQEGVEITILLDPIGNFFTTPSFWHHFREKRVKIRELYSYKNPWHIVSLRLLSCDHRKLIIVDGQVAFLGGLNISKKYRTNWRDTQIMIEGKAVEELCILYREVYTGRQNRQGESFDPVEVLKRPVTLIQTFPKEQLNQLKQSLLHLFSTAKHEIFVNHIYFIPPREILYALVAAAKRGVAVKILLSGITDLSTMQSAVRTNIAYLLKHAVRVFWYQACVNHSKTIVVDRQYSIISSANLNGRSFARNYELTAIIKNVHFAEMMHKMYEGDFLVSVEETIQHWKKRPWQQKLAECAVRPIRLLL